MDKQLVLNQDGQGNLQAGRDINLFVQEDTISVPEITAIVNKFINAPVICESKDFKVIDIEKKNALNGVSLEYFMEIKIDSLFGYDKIDALLKDPINEKLKDDFDSLASYLKGHYLLSNLKGKMERFIFKAIENFDKYETTLKERIWGRRLLNYMYLRCDIGLK